jgi:hypothetical protein
MFVFVFVFVVYLCSTYHVAFSFLFGAFRVPIFKLAQKMEGVLEMESTAGKYGISNGDHYGR